MDKKYIWFGIFALIILVVAYFGFGSNSSSSDAGLKLGVISPLDNIKGNASSSVVLMEYSDFQCPACKAYYPILRQLVVEYGDRVAFVYRHFPLSGIHPNAEFAARATEAARKQGKFWEMHDLLFEKQAEWSSVADIVTLFENYATLLGLNIENFRVDFRSEEVRDFVRNQRNHAIKSNLQGTPTFFVNGNQIKNPSSIEEFRTILNEALNKI